MSEETSGLLEISDRNVNTGTSSPPDFCGGAGRHDPCSQRTNNLPQLRRSPAHDSAIMHTCIDVQHYRQHASDDRSNTTQLVQGSTVNVLYRENVPTRLAPLYCTKRNSLYPSTASVPTVLLNGALHQALLCLVKAKFHYAS